MDNNNEQDNKIKNNKKIKSKNFNFNIFCNISWINYILFKI